MTVVVGVAIETVLRPNLLTGGYLQSLINTLLKIHGISISNTLNSRPGTYYHECLSWVFDGSDLKKHDINRVKSYGAVDPATAIRVWPAPQVYFIIASEGSQHLIEALVQLRLEFRVGDEDDGGVHCRPVAERCQPSAHTVAE